MALLAGACTASVRAADATQLPDDVMLTSPNISFFIDCVQLRSQPEERTENRAGQIGLKISISFDSV